jgi:hypothetical protein
MTVHKTAHDTHANATHTNQEEDAMTTPTKSTKSTKKKSIAAPLPATHATATVAPAPAPTASPSGAAPSLSPTTGIGLVFIQPPPAGVTIPVPPSGAPTNGAGNYRSAMPRAMELAALAGAVADLRRFTNFDEVFGMTGLPYEQVLQAFDVGNQWSSMRTASFVWDRYSTTMEGMGWEAIRAIMARLQPVFALAAVADQSLVTTFPSFAALLGAKKAIAKKAAATRKANNAAIARGEAPIHGIIGKKRQKKQAKALVAAANAAAPVATQPAPVAPAPVVTAPPPAAVATTNGASHS